MLSGWFGPELEITKNKDVVISGINWYLFEKDLVGLYGTTTMTKYMFKRLNSRRFKTKEFFLLELNHLIDKLLQLKSTRTSRKDLVKLSQLLLQETWIANTVVPAKTTFDYKQMQKKVKLKPFDTQLGFLTSYSSRKATYNLSGLLLDGKPGSGKAQPLRSKIKTPDGWTTMGEAFIGMEVSTPDGGKGYVTQIFPQGMTEVYTLTFTDGRKAEAHPEHLWKVYDSRTSAWSIKTTLELAELYHIGRFYIPLIESNVRVDTSTQAYLDGVNSRQGLPVTEYDEIRNQTEHYRYNWVRGVLSDDTVKGEYLDQEFSHFIVEIIRSTGHLGFNYPNGDLTIVEGHFGFNRIEITDITLNPEKELTQCITIDHPDHLYITDDFVVTHNTAMSLMWSTSLGEGKTVIVSPLNVVDEVWANHLSNNIKHEVWYTPPKFWTSKMTRPPEASDEFYVVHYEFLTNPLCEKYMRMIKSFNGRNSDFKLIVDECHNFNDPSSKRTKELIRYHKELGFTDSLPMSGTPLKGLGKEAYCVFCLIAPDFEGVVRDQFLDTYGRARDRLNELLSHRIGVKKYTINALQGMDDAPEPTRVKVKVPNADRFTLRAVRAEMAVYIKDRFKYYKENMDMYLDYFNETISEYRSAMTRAGDEKALADLETYLTIVNKFRRDGYNNFTDSDLSKQAKLIELDIEAWMKPTDRKYFRSAKSVVKYVGLKIQGEALGNVLGTARIEAVKALVEHADLPSYIDHVEKKTLVFTDHVDVVHETEDYLTRVGYKPQVVYGGNGKDRDKLVAEAEKNPDINPLITTFEMLGTGFPLIFANQVLCMNPPWRSHILTQTIARVHRQGQTAKQTFAYIFELDTGAEENVTSRTVDIMQWSKEQVDVLMGSTFGMDVEMVGVAGNEDLFSEEELSIVFNKLPKKESSLFDLF